MHIVRPTRSIVFVLIKASLSTRSMLSPKRTLNAAKLQVGGRFFLGRKEKLQGASCLSFIIDTPLEPHQFQYSCSLTDRNGELPYTSSFSVLVLLREQLLKQFLLEDLNCSSFQLILLSLDRFACTFFPAAHIPSCLPPYIPLYIPLYIPPYLPSTHKSK